MDSLVIDDKRALLPVGRPVVFVGARYAFCSSLVGRQPAATCGADFVWRLCIAATQSRLRASAEEPQNLVGARRSRRHLAAAWLGSPNGTLKKCAKYARLARCCE